MPGFELFLTEASATALPLLDSRHDPLLVAMSVGVAMFCSVTALRLLDIADRTAPLRLQSTAQAAGAVVMGVGIWVMHFIGMLALALCAPVGFAPLPTVLSVLPAVAAAWCCLHLLAQPAPTRAAWARTGLLLGGGVGAMHYAGMAAMDMAPQLRLLPGPFIGSLLFAVLASLAALALRERLRQWPGWSPRAVTWVAGCVLGAVISGMHYLGMAATRFVGQATLAQPQPPSALGPWVALGSLLACAGAVGGLLMLRSRQVALDLQASEAHYKALVAHIPGITFKARRGPDRRFHIAYISDAVEVLTGWSAQDVVSGRVRLEDALHPKDRAQLAAAMRAALDQQSSFRVEFRLTDRQGQEHWVAESATVVPDTMGGEPWLIGVLQDVTVQRRRSAEFEGVVAAIQRDLLVVEFDLAGRVVAVNEPFLALTGYRREELLGQPHALLRPAEDIASDAYLAHWRRLRAGEHCAGEFTLVRADGSRLWVHATYNPILDLDGQPCRVIKFVTDLTHQRDLAAQLRAARDKAEQAAQAKSSFLANMSHEIRTPLNGVIGLTEMLQQSALDLQQQETADLIKDSAYSLLGIIEDILDFSKIEAGRLELELAPMDPAQVVEQVAAMLDQVALKKDVDLLLFTDPALPPQVLGDALRLRQIVVNLAGNAVKFSASPERRGQVLLQLAPARAEDGAQLLSLSVRDNGIGMDAATQARLFKPFAQADASTTRHFGGTGLGLVITQELVRAMGGRMLLDSAPGLGSCFTVLLPCRQAPAPVAPPLPAAPLAGTVCGLLAAPDAFAHLLGRTLAAAGATVLCAASLDEAVRLGQLTPPELWLLDDPDNTLLQNPRLATLEPAGRCLVLGRGRRRQARRPEGSPLLSMDLNVLTRRQLLRTVQLMLADPAAAALATARPVAAPAAPAEPAPSHPGVRLLVAEDNPANQKVIRFQLGKLGYTAEVAGDGQQALALWRSGGFDLLLTDLHMPHLDGYQLTAAIRAEEAARGASPPLPIIALTANALSGEAERCTEAGMSDYLSKPTRLPQLQAMLAHWLPGR